MYNGNISETYWRTGSDDIKRKYGYKYDALNRLTEAIYQKPNETVPVTNSYNESLSYDKNGNIISLVRNGEFDDANYALEIDNLTYTYHPDKLNQLMNLVDSSNNPNGFKDDTNPENENDYDYDANGNMTQDNNKGVREIIYNHLNLPTKIEFANHSRIEYLYNATGQKIKKVVYPQTGSAVETEYLDGFQYSKVNDTAAVVLDFFPHAEGYVKVSGESTDYDYSYVYNYLDHLGNVRLSYGKEPNGDVVKILEENNYYPFGMKHNNYNIDKLQYEKYGSELSIEYCTNCSYKYKYNGKEYQDELGLNMYDYGARNYDAAIGRWMNIDPLAENSRRWTPYNYAYNNPIFFIDPDGMQAIENDELDLTFDSPVAKQAYTATVNNAMGGLYQANSDPLLGGKVEVSSTGVQGAMTQEQQAFYDEFSSVVNSDIDVKMSVSFNTETQVGNFQTGDIDIYDVIQFDRAGTGGTTSAGAVIHETVEQFEKTKLGLGPGEYSKNPSISVNGPEFVSSHETALKAEDKVNGNTRTQNPNGTSTFIEKNSTKTLQQLKFFQGGGFKVIKTKIP